MASAKFGSSSQRQGMAKVEHCRASGKNCGLLKVGGVHKRRRVLSQAKMFHVSDDPHDLPRPLFIYGIGIVPEEQVLPDGIFIREEPPGERLIDDQRPRCALVVMLVQVAPFP